MSTIKAELEHVFFKSNKVDLFQVKIYGFESRFYSEREKLMITIEGEGTYEKAHDLLMDLLCIFFLFLGGFPQLLKIEANNKQIDTKNYVSKYKTWDYLICNDLAVCSINVDTINEQTLQRYNEIPQWPLFSLQYLVSENYQYILIPHRNTLLLHIVDGIVPDKIQKKTEEEMSVRYQDQEQCTADKIGLYIAKAYYLCSKHFFEYEEAFECDILSILQTSQFEFLRKITDTRNGYSHFSRKSRKLEKGEDMLFYFHIIYYVIRLYLIDKLRITFNKDVAAEYFYKIHDYISEVNKCNWPLKSKAYRINPMIKELYEYFRKYAKTQEENQSSFIKRRKD